MTFRNVHDKDHTLKTFWKKHKSRPLSEFMAQKELSGASARRKMAPLSAAVFFRNIGTERNLGRGGLKKSFFVSLFSSLTIKKKKVNAGLMRGRGYWFGFLNK